MRNCKILVCSLVFVLFGLGIVNAQSLPCNGHLNVSLDSECKYAVKPVAMIAGGTSSTGYTVKLENHYDEPIADDTLRYEHLGQTVTVHVIDNSSTNSCWGTIFVEDKKAPTLVCGTMNVVCYDETTHLPTATDNCDPDVKIIPIGQSTTLSDCDPANSILKTIATEYIAEDKFGFKSTPCVHTINILRIDQTKIDPPEDFVETNSFICNSDFPKDENGNPHPDTTGIPYLVIGLDSIALWPDINDLCKARMTYRDNVLGAGTCKEKVMRTWSFFDACTSVDPYTFTQMIWVIDNVGPTLDCEESLTIVGTPLSTPSATDCLLAASIPPALASDNCSTVRRIGVNIKPSDSTEPSTPILGTNGGIIRRAPGTYDLTYTAWDGCNESTPCETQLTLVDNSPPVVICDRHTVIGLTSDGSVEVAASVFDDGSFDACGLDKMLIARVGAEICDTLDYEFGPSISFCCEDADSTVSAIFRVVDVSGMVNDCDVSIEIQDKTAPNANCPAGQAVECDHPIDINDLSQFGTATSNNRCRTGVTEIDPIVNLGTCNNGTITRRWTGASTGDAVICTQTISITNPYSFDYDNIEQIVSMPRDIDTTGACGLALLPDDLPAGAQRPEILETNSCDLIGTTYKDEEYVFADETRACLKIVRTWTVLNWCAPDGQNALELAQVIKVTDTEGPELTLDTLNQVEYCNDTQNCENGVVSLSAYATDNCSTSLIPVITVDLGNDGSIDETFPVIPTVIGDSISKATLSFTYPLGTHRVLFSFTDGCGIRSVSEHIFTLKNCKAPTCALNDLNINIASMPEGIMACIWASDFDASSIANCSEETLSFYFDDALTMGSRCFTCDDVLTQTIDVYVVDQFGNSALCRPALTVTDHETLCSSNLEGPNLTETISGHVLNHRGEMIKEAKVNLSNTEFPSTMTNRNGSYAFDNIPTELEYMVNVSKDDDYMNGVSTLDLVLIQKHILGLQILDNPYDMIAADINNSGSISALDLVELRKVILGEQDKFSANTSWRFIDRAYSFENESNPWTEKFPESYEIENLLTPMNIDFIGLKVGDVSGNATTNAVPKPEVRSNKSLRLTTSHISEEHSNIAIVELTSDNFENVNGFQTTFEFNNDLVEYISVEGVALDVSQNNVGKKNSSRGVITFSWSEANRITVNENDVLFKLVFRKIVDTNFTLDATSQILNTEVYFNEVVSDRIQIINPEGKFTIAQNNPNPWSDKTEIGFIAHNKQDFNLKIYDLFGKRIYSESVQANVGQNNFTLDRSKIQSAGIYLYEISNGKEKLINKMIIID